MSIKSLLAAIALAAAISQPAMAQGLPEFLEGSGEAAGTANSTQRALLFRGTHTSLESQSGGTFPVFLQVLDGSGKANLGRFTVQALWNVNVVTGAGLGTFTLTGANGDTLGGSATGAFVTARVLTFASPPGSAPEESMSSFEGTIMLH